MVMKSVVFFIHTAYSLVAFSTCSNILKLRSTPAITSRSANLSCFANLLPGDRIIAMSWSKGVEFIGSVSSHHISLNGQSNLRKRGDLFLENDTWLLSINPVRCHDEGLYSCELSYSKAGENITMETDKIELTVEVPAKVVTMESHISKEEQVLAVECDVELGKPNGTLSWYILDESGRVSSTKYIHINHFYTEDKCSRKDKSTMTVKVNPDVNAVQCQVYNKHSGMDTVDIGCTRYPESCGRVVACEVGSMESCQRYNGDTWKVSLPMATVIAISSVVATVLTFCVALAMKRHILNGVRRRRQKRTNPYTSTQGNTNYAGPEDSHYDRISRNSSSYITFTSVHGSANN